MAPPPAARSAYTWPVERVLPPISAAGGIEASASAPVPVLPTLPVRREGLDVVEPVRVYVDMVADLFHPGHVELLRRARSFGDLLVVGVLSDDVVAAYKRRPIMTLEERVAVVRACRYVDEVIPDAPDVVSMDFLGQHDLSFVVHGDDISEEVIDELYGEVAAAGKLRLVPRAPGISTTELIARVQQRTDRLRP